MVSVSFFKTAIISSVLLVGCVTTKYTYEFGHPAKIHLVENDVLLIPWLPEENAEMYLEKIAGMFKAKGIYAKYLIAEEWEINRSAIEYPIDTGDFDILSDLGYTHILFIHNSRHKRAPAFSYYTPLEVSQEYNRDTFKPTLENVGNQSDMYISLISLERPYGEYSVAVSTNIGNMKFRQSDDGEFQVNLSDEEMAANKAISRGIKRLIKDCYSK